jgi:hypothetical protein
VAPTTNMHEDHVSSIGMRHLLSIYRLTPEGWVIKKGGGEKGGRLLPPPEDSRAVARSSAPCILRFIHF